MGNWIENNRKRKERGKERETVRQERKTDRIKKEVKIGNVGMFIERTHGETTKR